MKKIDYDYNIKLLMIGDSGAGKTSLVSRYVDDAFNLSMTSTIGIDFKIKNIVINNKKIKLQIWDTAGQERYRTITRAYYRGAMGTIFVFSLDNPHSFNNIKNWLSIVNEYTGHRASRLLIGNKSDLKNSETYIPSLSSATSVPNEEIQKLVHEHNMQYIETSAKNNTNVELVFTTITKDILDHVDEYNNQTKLDTTVSKPDIVNVDHIQLEKKRSCC